MTNVECKDTVENCGYISDKVASPDIKEKIRYIESNISNEKKWKVIPKFLWNNFFRVNFYEQIPGDDECVLTTWSMPRSCFMRLDGDADSGYEIVIITDSIYIDQRGKIKKIFHDE